MQQYNKEQLTGKTLDELREIADEYKINSNGLGERDLVYEILEEQARDCSMTVRLQVFM